MRTENQRQGFGPVAGLRMCIRIEEAERQKPETEASMKKITTTLEFSPSPDVPTRYRVASIKNAGRIPSHENPGGNRLCAHVGSWLEEEQLELIACEFTINLVSDARIRRDS